MLSTMFIAFLILVIIGAPIAFVLAGSSMAALWFGTTQPMVLIVQQFFTGMDSFPLLAIPLFMVAGSLMGHGGISSRLIKFVDTMIGHKTAGLAYVAIVSCMIFAAISGSGPATVAALGSILIPGMIKAGYDPAFASAVMAISGAIGIIIPPSIPMVTYSTSANVSVGNMFLGGFLPGITVGMALMIVSYFISKKRGYGEKRAKASAQERWAAFKDAILALLMPVIILGGIYGGIFTPTEAAAVAVFYGLIVGVVIFKELNLASIKNVLLDGSKNTAMVMMIIGAAKGFAWILSSARVPDAVARFITGLTDSAFMILLLINILLLIVGCLMEANAAIVILTPIFMPVITSMGINPIHFGIIMIVNLAIGMSTPPLGVNLFVASGISKVTLEKIIKAVLPLIAANIVALLVITYLEPLTLVLVNLFGT